MNMYKIYNEEKGIRIFLYLFDLLLLGLGIASWVSVFSGEEVAVGIFAGLFFFGLAFIFFKLASANSNPYARIDELRKQNPELVTAIEREFEIAENIGNRIWFGPTHIFLHSSLFEVAQYNEISGVRLYKSYSSKSTFYKIELIIGECKVRVYFTKYGENRNLAIQSANRIAYLSGTTLINELDM